MNELLTLDEVAATIHTPVGTLRFWRHKDTGPKSFKIGRRVMYRAEDVQAWVTEQYETNQRTIVKEH